jgi:hypothetical protein
MSAIDRFQMKSYPEPILAGKGNYIPFFKQEKLIAYAPSHLKNSFERYWMRKLDGDISDQNAAF